ncbi:hypothetical protein GCM10023085_68940 [Actinomadura viridis]|uniref:Branched-subunit amino acid permease n=1 Tax=Actinomadura viridis TaxID=58110 RepID=A0A931DFS6_9ACTN|nr:AzlC family ABC transporter permease [Actinomadura viridis]MBG6088432.1 putative branched-subunit amino acid permease [Actinomadura viridis]
MNVTEATVTDAPGNAPERSAAVRDGLGVGLAVGASGLAFGAAGITAGLSVAQTCALSLLTFSGASQFALIGVIGAGGNLATGVMGAVLLGGRNALYGLRLADLLRVRGVRRLLTAQVVIDETTAVASAQPDRAAARVGFYATAISIYLSWNLTTLLGALGAARLGDPETLGLDVLGPAVFLALLWPRLTAGRTEGRVAAGAAVIALATTPVLPAGVPVMVAAVAALVAIVPPRRRRRPGSPGETDGRSGPGERKEGTAP